MYLYLYLSTFKSTCILLKYFSKNNAMYLYLYFNKCKSTCTLLKYFHMYFTPCLMHTHTYTFTYSLTRQTLKKGLVKRPLWFCVAEFASMDTHMYIHAHTYIYTNTTCTHVHRCMHIRAYTIQATQYIHTYHSKHFQTFPELPLNNSIKTEHLCK